MNEREELEALRRLAALEAKAGNSATPAQPPAAPDPSAGGGRLRFGPIDTGLNTPEWLDRTLAGTGKAMSDVGTGVRQLGAQVADAVSPRAPTMSGLITGQPASRVDEMRQQVAEDRKRDAPLMATAAGKVGNLLGNVAMVAPTAMIPGANTYAGAGLIGAVSGLLQPSESAGETATNVGLGAAGGVGGQGAANLIGKLASRGGTQVTQGQAVAAQGGNALGMRLTPGKASGSASLQKLEAGMESNPLTSGGFDAIKEGNQKALNRAAAKAIGEKADELSTPILARAEARIGAVFDKVADATPVPLDPQVVGGKLRQIVADSDGLIGGNASLADNALIQRLDGFINGAGGATREQLRAMSSKLGKAARNNMTTPNGDRELGQAMFAAQEVVEDAIQGSLSGAQKAAYAEAREQYRNMMTLTAKTNVVNPSNGNVSGRSLATTLMQKDRGGFTMGRNTSDLYGAARFSQAFPDIVGNSGTATRSMGPADYAAGLPGNLLARAYLSRPVASAAGAGAGAVGLGARLAAPATNLLGRPLGVAGPASVANWLEQ